MLSLSKGDKLSLTKVAPKLTKLVLGLGWKARTTVGAAFDLDAMLFSLNEAGKSVGDKGVCYFGQLKALDGAVTHSGDNRTGEGEGDDESITIDLSKVPADVKKFVVIVSIDKADERKQTFGQVSNAYVRFYDADTKVDVAKFDLTEDASTEQVMTFAEVYNHNGEWKVNAVGAGYKGGLKAFGKDYGVDFGD